MVNFEVSFHIATHNLFYKSFVSACMCLSVSFSPFFLVFYSYHFAEFILFILFFAMQTYSNEQEERPSDTHILEFEYTFLNYTLNNNGGAHFPGIVRISHHIQYFFSLTIVCESLLHTYTCCTQILAKLLCVPEHLHMYAYISLLS